MKRMIACLSRSGCLYAVASAAAWMAKKTQRELILFNVMDYAWDDFHLYEFSGIGGFEAHAMLMQEWGDVEENQDHLLQQQSNELLEDVQQFIFKKYGIRGKTLQKTGLFPREAFEELLAEDIVVLGKYSDHDSEQDKALASQLENFIRGCDATVLTVTQEFTIPTQFLFAYDPSATCDNMLKRICQSRILKGLTCHLIHVGEDTGILPPVAEELQNAGYVVESDYLSGDVTEAILAYQQQHQLDWLVIGAFSHSRLHQFFLGGTTLKIFAQSDVPIFVIR